MTRILALAACAALTLSSCASAPPPSVSKASSLPGPDDGNPPWGALISPNAALKVVLEDICLPAVMDNLSIADLAQARSLDPVPPESTGSTQAVAAWRLAAWNTVYVMQLPNGGCSAALEAGDATYLSDIAIEMLKARAAFAPGETVPARNGEAENTAWCTPEMDRPVVAGVMKKTGGSGPALLLNVFRAQSARPPFCPRIGA